MCNISFLTVLITATIFGQSAAFVLSRTEQGRLHSSLHASVDTKNKQKEVGGTSVELGIPCEEECALEKFPKLPASIYPGVLSGQAQMDLLNHAKENGTCFHDTKKVVNTR
jgi:hypothetical protein